MGAKVDVTSWLALSFEVEGSAILVVGVLRVHRIDVGLLFGSEVHLCFIISLI